MKEYGTVRSTVRPEDLLIDEYSVWIHTDITEISEFVGEENEFVGFEYQMVQYEKDEYMKSMAEKTARLDAQLTDTQLALCDLYEGKV